MSPFLDPEAVRQLTGLEKFMVRYVLLPRFHDLTGYTEKAVRRKIEDGVWRENEVWIKAPDGHILIDLRGYESWVVGVKVAA